jgi:hypothetical protein
MADNSSKKFKFISPGVFIDEIDNSQLPETPTAVGPVIIGRSRKGPGDKPVQINSYSDFVQTFGNPVAGNEGGDVWRDGNHTAPTYAAYAAKAWLRNNSPITFVRTLGSQDSNATDDGKAGWEVNTANSGNTGGVFALVVWPSSSLSGAFDGGADGTAGGLTAPVTGTVAAQFYTNGRVLLSGSTSEGSAGSTLYEVADKDSFTLVFTGSSQPLAELKVSLNPDSEHFIRKALNTNPTVMNSNITTSTTRDFYQGGHYFLGESYEYSVAAAGADSIGLLAGISSGSSDGSGSVSYSKFHAAIMPMVVNGTASIQQNNFRGAAQKASTGWFISQDLSEDTGSYTARTQQKLFRLEALTAGAWAQEEVKLSISNIKAPTGNYETYGSFSVLVRRLSDTDDRQEIVERYDNLDLNPVSENYLAKRIGDRYQVYDASAERNVEYGEFENRSNYIRVVMNEDVAAGTLETRLLPFGMFGPIKYRDVSMTSGSAGFSPYGTYNIDAGRGNTQTMLDGSSSAAYGDAGYLPSIAPDAGILNVDLLNVASAARTAFSASIRFPSVPLRTKSAWGSPRSAKNTFWGAWTGRSSTDTFFNPQILDCLRPRSFDQTVTAAPLSVDVAGETSALTGSQAYEAAWVFSLDNISGSAADGYQYANTYRSAGTSVTAAGSTGYKAAITAGLDRFTTTLHGGFDGYNIKERDPFRNSQSDFAAATQGNTSYQLFSLKKAINMVASPDDVQMNAIVIPGIIRPQVTNYLLEIAEDRGDSLAIIDIQNAYTPDTEGTGSAEDRNSGNTPAAAATTLANRSINNSYGAAYYPWVSILDTNTNQRLWAPPSVAALGVLSNTDRQQAPWFAPAGFTRGGLSEGAAGVPVLDVSRKLTADDRDTLYENNINPIAKFPAEGIVIFGQKTLQQTASALDRINVRRLMIYLKREISFIASRLIFAPNTPATWDRFLGQAEPLLRDVKSQFGIDDFRLILDESTTTPDLIDRNIIYAKLFVKPTRSVEFFAIDFIITNNGASFED